MHDASSGFAATWSMDCSQVGASCPSGSTLTPSSQLQSLPSLVRHCSLYGGQLFAVFSLSGGTSDSASPLSGSFAAKSLRKSEHSRSKLMASS